MRKSILLLFVLILGTFAYADPITYSWSNPSFYNSLYASGSANDLEVQGSGLLLEVNDPSGHSSGSIDFSLGDATIRSMIVHGIINLSLDDVTGTYYGVECIASDCTLVHGSFVDVFQLGQAACCNTTWGFGDAGRVTVLAGVPEPSTWALIAAGLGCFLIPNLRQVLSQQQGRDG